MPSTVNQLFRSIGAPSMGSVRWGNPIPTNASGVYVVALTPNPDAEFKTDCPVDLDSIAAWIQRVPKMLVDGKTPTPRVLQKRLSEFWIEDEPVIYIGKATSLRSRVGGYYRTPLGDRRPHAGGHWIKTISVLPHTFVHFTESVQPERAEATLLQTFVDGVSKVSRSRLRDPSLPIPFANLEFPRGTRKRHGIQNAKLRDSPNAER